MMKTRQEVPICVICVQTISRPSSTSHCESCGRYFHPHHLRIWLKKSSLCPYCTQGLSADIISQHRTVVPDIPVVRQVGSLDLTRNQAASKMHTAYFEEEGRYTRKECSCHVVNLMPVTKEGWANGILGFVVGIVFVSFYLSMFLAAEFAGGNEAMISYLFVTIAALSTFVLGLGSLVFTGLVFVLTRYSCELHTLL